MGSTLRIDRRALGSGAAGAWRLLLDHTACGKGTANLPVQPTEARRGGAIDHCVVLAEPTGRSEGETGGGANGSLRLVRPAIRTGAAVEPGRMDARPSRRHRMIGDRGASHGVEAR